MFPGIAATGGLLLMQVLSAVSNTHQITYPAGIQAGDLIVLFEGAINNPASIPTNVNITGYTQIQNTASNPARVKSSYRVADGSESGVITGLNGTGRDQKVMLVFRGSRPVVGWSIGGSATSGLTASNPTPQVVPAASESAPLVVLGFYWSTGAVNPRTMTPTKTGELQQQSTDDLWVAWDIQNAVTVNTTVDMDDEGSNVMHSCYFAAT